MTAVFDPAVEDELNKARDCLREIDDSIKNLTGRTPQESGRFGGRGGGPGRGGGGRFGTNNRLFQVSVRDEPVGMGGGAPVMGRRRTFAQTRGEEENGREWDNYGKRARRSFAGTEQDMMDIPPPPPLFIPKPAVASHVNLPAKDEKSRDEAITEIRGTEKKEQAVRNRRMFGVLMGTLSKFKKEEQRELQFKEQEKKQKEVEQKLESEKKEVADKIRREKDELMDKRRQQEDEIRRLQRKRILMQFAEREEHHLKQLQRFIQTNAKPPIFYTPAKHTLRTIELQKKTERRLEEMIQKRRQELQAKLDQDPILNPGKQSALDGVELKVMPGVGPSSRGPGRRNRRASENEDDSDVDGDEEKHSSDEGDATDTEEKKTSGPAVEPEGEPEKTGSEGQTGLKGEGESEGGVEGDEKMEEKESKDDNQEGAME